jgi:hypothetical protein
MRLEFDANTPTTVQYLFWDNPRNKYYLNGKRVAIHNDNGLISIHAPAGTNILEVKYVHKPLILFWIAYAAFGFLLLCAFIPKRLSMAIKSIYRRVRGTHGT